MTQNLFLRPVLGAELRLNNPRGSPLGPGNRLSNPEGSTLRHGNRLGNPECSTLGAELRHTNPERSVIGAALRLGNPEGFDGAVQGTENGTTHSTATGEPVEFDKFDPRSVISSYMD